MATGEGSPKKKKKNLTSVQREPQGHLEDPLSSKCVLLSVLFVGEHTQSTLNWKAGTISMVNSNFPMVSQRPLQKGTMKGIRP